MGWLHRSWSLWQGQRQGQGGPGRAGSLRALWPGKTGRQERWLWDCNWGVPCAETGSGCWMGWDVGGGAGQGLVRPPEQDGEAVAVPALQGLCHGASPPVPAVWGLHLRAERDGAGVARWWQQDCGTDRQTWLWHQRGGAAQLALGCWQSHPCPCPPTGTDFALGHGLDLGAGSSARHVAH